jgi:hypothetical protein
MKKIINGIILLSTLIQSGNAALTQMKIYSEIKPDRFSDPSPLSALMPVMLTLQYDSTQIENPELTGTGDAFLDGLNAATSRYTINSTTSSLSIGPYTWEINQYDIELGNDAPFLAPQDYFKVSFNALVPGQFVDLGFIELTDYFNFDIRDYGTLSGGNMLFLDSTALPLPGSTFNYLNSDYSGSYIYGKTTPINWFTSITKPTRVEITQIPEVGATSLLLVSLSTLVFKRRRLEQ